MLEDIGALFTFIKAAPFDSIATFRHFIVTPFLEGDERRTIASERLSLLLDSVCLRRTRDLLHLPDPREITRPVELSKEEQSQYNTTMKMMGQALRQKVGEGDKKHLFGMFQAQLQLRILANHGTFQQPFSWNDPRNMQMEREDALCSVGQNGDIVCSRCRQTMPLLGTNRVTRKYPETCAHVLCSECMDEKIQEGATDSDLVFKCPLCYPIGPGSTKKAIDTDRASAGERHDNYFRPLGYSSKMAAIMEDVQEDLWTTKSIIFSCWTRTLDLVGRHLRQLAIPYERIDGECPLARRQQILDDFAINSRIPVLIMTTGVGAFGYVALALAFASFRSCFHPCSRSPSSALEACVTGANYQSSLNLTAANRVFIVEPQWNPSVEKQAVARALRLGQGQSVLVTRYITNHTVEQEMRSQQNRKLRLAEIGWEQSLATQ